jgi:AcrR family transcriptional regulator
MSKMEADHPAGPPTGRGISGSQHLGVPVSDPAKADGRRTDTRRRIHEAALEVFAEVGYERGTLQQIADRLGITRPALYYHYHAELAQSVDATIDWARAQPRTRATRHETLQRLNHLLLGPWGTFTRIAQASEAAMRDLPAIEEFTRRMNAIGDILSPANDPAGRIRGRLALAALFMATTRGEQLGGTTNQRNTAALDISYTLTR